MRCVVCCGSTSFQWLVFFFGALLWGSMIHKQTGRWMCSRSTANPLVAFAILFTVIVEKWICRKGNPLTCLPCSSRGQHKRRCVSVGIDRIGMCIQRAPYWSVNANSVREERRSRNEKELECGSLRHWQSQVVATYWQLWQSKLLLPRDLQLHTRTLRQQRHCKREAAL